MMNALLKSLISDKRKAFTTAFLFLCVLAFSQPVGYFGKRWLIKTTVINGLNAGLFSGYEVEYVLSRRSSLQVSYNLVNFTRGEKGVRVNTGEVVPRGRMGRFKERSTLSNGTTSGNHFGLSYRRYFNGIIPAPYGWYMSVYAGYGKASYADYTVSYSYKEKMTSVDLEGVSERDPVKDLHGESSFFILEAPAIGYQRIFKRVIVFDLQAAITTQYTKLPDVLSNALEHNFYLRANTVSYAHGGYNSGLSLYAKIGFLLF